MSRRRFVTVEDVYAPGREPGGYLRWREAHPAAAVEHDALWSPPACERCGAPFVRSRSNRRFGSAVCRRSAWRRQDRLRWLARPPLPPPTPERRAEISAECERALALAEAAL